MIEPDDSEAPRAAGPSAEPGGSSPLRSAATRKRRRLWGFVCGAVLGASLLELGLLHTLLILAFGVAGMYLAGDADELRAKLRRWI